MAFTAGKVNISANNLTVGAISGYSASNYIVMSSIGELRQSVGNSNVVYPVGIASAYNPLTLKDNANTNTYGVSVKQGFAAANPPIGADWVDRQWTITKTTPSAASTDATFQWNSPSEQQGSFNTNLCSIGHYSGGTWDYNAAAAATCAGGICTRTRTGLTSFSPFGVISGAVVLPVEFVNFKATPQYKAVLLNWQTASETNNKGFQIERSSNGKSFGNIGFIKAKGSNAVYDFTDDTPLSMNYYRLRQIDMDGKEAFSKVISANMDENKGKMYFAPNPAKDHLTITINDNNSASIRLFDLLGRLVLSKSISDVTTDLDISTIKAGHYILEIASNGQVFREPLIKM